MLHFFNLSEWSFLVCLIIFFSPALLFLIRRRSSKLGPHRLPPDQKDGLYSATCSTSAQCHTGLSLT
ncbi:hypothetical protein ACFX2I_009276 [Malus domestica]